MTIYIYIHRMMLQVQVGPFTFEPGSKLLVLGMVIQPLIGNPYNGYINPYYWVDDHPLLYGNNGSLDPSPSTFNSLHRRCMIFHFSSQKSTGNLSEKFIEI